MTKTTTTPGLKPCQDRAPIKHWAKVSLAIVASCLAAILPGSASAEDASQALTPRPGSSYLIKRVTTFNVSASPSETMEETFRRRVISSSKLDYFVVETVLSMKQNGQEQLPEEVRSGKVDIPDRQMRFHLLMASSSLIPMPAKGSSEKPEEMRFEMRKSTNECESELLDAFFSPLGGLSHATFSCVVKSQNFQGQPVENTTQFTYVYGGVSQLAIQAGKFDVQKVTASFQGAGGKSSTVYYMDTTRGIVLLAEQTSTNPAGRVSTVRTEVIEPPPVNSSK